MLTKKDRMNRVQPKKSLKTLSSLQSLNFNSVGQLTCFCP